MLLITAMVGIGSTIRPGIQTGAITISAAVRITAIGWTVVEMPSRFHTTLYGTYRILICRLAGCLGLFRLPVMAVSMAMCPCRSRKKRRCQNACHTCCHKLLPEHCLNFHNCILLSFPDPFCFFFSFFCQTIVIYNDYRLIQKKNNEEPFYHSIKIFPKRRIASFIMESVILSDKLAEFIAFFGGYNIIAIPTLQQLSEDGHIKELTVRSK